jgi:predicted transcriptional regulator
MTRSLTLHLDQFGQEAIDRIVRERRGSRSAFVRTAALYYLADSDQGRPAWRALPCQRAREVEPSVTVALDEDTWLSLEWEAGRQGIDAGRLAEHAVLYYLADLDSGRLASRVGAAIERES